MNETGTASCSERLFSYGTLQLPAVQIENFGRELVGNADSIRGYRLAQLKITDPQVIATSGRDVHPILIPTGDDADLVSGMVFLLSPAELLRADSYEVDDYQRVLADCSSGEQAWVYVSAVEC